LVDWAGAGGDGRGWLVAADLLVLIRMLIFFTSDFGCATKIFDGLQLMDICDSQSIHAVATNTSNHQNLKLLIQI
jgi:hypothetical protein